MLSLGTFHYPTSSPRRAGSPVMGASVAVESFMRNVLSCSATARWRIFASPPDVAAAREQLQALRRFLPRSARADVHAWPTFAAAPEKTPLSAWHDVNSDVRRPFHLRRLAGGRYPITVTHHTLSYASNLSEWYLPLLLGDVRACDALVCTSSAAKENIRRTLAHVAEAFERDHGARLSFGGRLEVLPLGVDTALFCPRDQADARYQVGLPAEPLIVMHLGRVSAADKADLLPLLRVWKRIAGGPAPAGARPLLLVIAGSAVGPNKRILAEYATALGVADKVVLREADPGIRHLLHAAADVFVAPVDNLQETFGLSPVEAMACGIPQVASDWDGYRDTVCHEDTGFLVPTAWARCDSDLRGRAVLREWAPDHLALAQSVVVDLDAMEGALRALLGSPDLRARMAQASRRRALERFAWPVVVAGYEALWAELGAVASVLPPGPVRAEGHLHPIYCEGFQAYPTSWLPGDARVILTADGRAVLRGEEPLPAYFADGDALSSDPAEDLLTTLRKRGRHTLDSLVAAHAGPGMPEDAVRRRALWLVKYGFARVEATSPRRRGDGTVGP